MSNPIIVNETGTATMPVPPKVLVLKRVNIFVGAFFVLLLSNLFLTVGIFTFGVSSGNEGQASFSWVRLGETISFLFGSLGSFLALIGLIAIIGVVLWLVKRVGDAGHGGWSAAIFVVGIIAAVALWPFIASGLGSVGFGIIPLLIFVAFTALVAFLIALVVPVTTKIRLPRKRGTNH